MIRLLLGILLLSTIISADGWRETTKTCPVCLHNNIFLQPTEFSDEIYMRPSRFQYVFSPFTDTRSLYCCEKCCYTTFSWHFQQLTIDKLEIITEALKGKFFDHKKYGSYDEIPASLKLDIAEEVYKLWGRDENFWCEFYRTKAYHLEKEIDKLKKEGKMLSAQKQNPSKHQSPGKIKIVLTTLFYPLLKFVISQQTETLMEDYSYQNMLDSQNNIVAMVDISRRKALEIATTILADPNSSWPKKEYLFIAGAMEYLLANKEKAKNYFEEGLKVDYKSPQMNEEQAEGYNIYLNQLLQDYLKKFE